MKKGKQEKNNSKETKLPPIQSNLQKGSLKQPKEKSNSNAKNQKTNSNSSNNQKMPNIPLTNRNIPENLNQLSDKNNMKSGRKKNLNKIQIKEEEVEPIEEKKEEGPRISQEKLCELKAQRKKRIQKEKKEEEKEIKLYTELVEEYKNSNKKKKKDYNSKILENVKTTNITGDKAQKILEEGGMLDAYKHVLAQLCKQGLPTGNIFEYASIVVKNYEKKWKEKKSKMIKEKIDKYYEEKQKELETINDENNTDIKIINKSLEHREELKFIQSLDKSRSKRNVIHRAGSFNNLNENNTFNSNNNIGKSFNNEIKKKPEVNLVDKKNKNNTSPKSENNNDNNNKNKKRKK